MNIYLDDTFNIYPNPWVENDPRWVGVTSNDEFQAAIEKYGEMEGEFPLKVSLDYELGTTENGTKSLKFLLNYCRKYGFNVPEICVHSQTHQALSRMQEITDKFTEETGVEVKIYAPRGIIRAFQQKDLEPILS